MDPDEPFKGVCSFPNDSECDPDDKLNVSDCAISPVDSSLAFDHIFISSVYQIPDDL